MDLLSLRIKNLAPSATIAMAQKSRELKAKGIDIVDLSLGQPDFHTPEHIKEAAKKAVDENYTFYTPVPGYADVREAICAKFKRDNKLDYSPDQIVCSTGAKQTLANVIFALVDPGDQVVMPAPYWVSYGSQIELAGGVIVSIPTRIDNDFKITAAELESHLSDRTKILLFSSPCNPTGSVYSEKELRALAEVLKKYPNVIVISDEIYELINYTEEHFSIARIEGMKERTVTVNGLSKGFSMTGWRLGYMAAPLWLAKACNKFQGQFTSATCSITQRATIAALTEDYGPSLMMKKSFKERRDLMNSLLREIPDIGVNLPEGAFYFFIDISKYLGKSYEGTAINNNTELSMYLLESGHVAMVSGEAFGDDNSIRLSYATSEENLRKAADRLKTALARLS